MAPFQVFVKCLDGHTRCLKFEKSLLPYEDLQQVVCVIEGVRASDLRFVTGTKEVGSGSSLVAVQDFFPSINVLLRLRGGKGGFGSLLRGAATKAGQKKTSNFDACRDMSGRRLRHVNAEKKLKEWKSEVKERELEKIAEEFLKKERKKKDEDTGINKEIAEFREATVKNMEEVELAVLSGLKESRRLGTNGKRKKIEAIETAAKRASIWFAEVEENDEVEDGEDEDVLSNHPAKKLQKIEGVELLEKNKAVDFVPPAQEGASPSQQSSEQAMAETLSESSSSVYGQEVEPCSSDEEVKPAVLEAGQDETETETELLQDIHAEDGTGPIVENHSSDCSQHGRELEPRSSIDKGISVVASLEGESRNESPKDIHVGNSYVSVVENAGNDSDCSQKTAEATTGISDEKLLKFDEFATAKDMEVLGLERLKMELQVRGLKCGGSLLERASRLFLLKSTPIELLDKKHFAKSKASGSSSH